MPVDEILKNNSLNMYPSIENWFCNESCCVTSNSLIGKPGEISPEHKARLEQLKSFRLPQEIIDEFYLENGRTLKEALNDIEKPVKSGWIDATTLIKDTNLLNIK